MTTEENDIYPEDQVWLEEQLKAMTFAKALKAHRMCNDWTQEETAQRLDVSKQLISAYENGRKIPRPALAYKMGEALGMSPKMAVIYAVNDALRYESLPVEVSLAG